MGKKIYRILLLSTAVMTAGVSASAFSVFEEVQEEPANTADIFSIPEESLESGMLQEEENAAGVLSEVFSEEIDAEDIFSDTEDTDEIFQTPDTRYLTANTYMELSALVSSVALPEAQTMAASVQDEVPYEFSLSRLIVKTDGEPIDFSGCGASAIIAGPENHYFLQFADPLQAYEQYRILLQVSSIIYVEPDAPIEAEETFGIAGYGLSENEAASVPEMCEKNWGMLRTGLDSYSEFLAPMLAGKSLLIGVVDSGVDLNNPNLKDRIVSGGYDFVDNDDVPQDLHYHGTHVSGILAQGTRGNAVYLLPERVLDSQGRGSNSVMATALRHAVDAGVDVINLSVTGIHSDFKDEAIAYALSHQVAVIAAAGNKGVNVDTVCPAHNSDVIVVSGTDQQDERAVSLTWTSNYGEGVDLCAPSMNIYSCMYYPHTGSEYAFVSGTSQATPHVTAAAALFLLQDPSLTPGQLEAKLMQSTRDLGNPGKDSFFGAGILDLRQYGFVNRSNGDTCFFDSEGKLAKGFQVIETSAYYFDESGAMVRGLLQIDGNTYFFGNDGKMQIGWQTIDGAVYFFGDDGAAVKGWQTIDGKTYFFDAAGIRMTGIIAIGENRYLLRPGTGELLSGWWKLDGYWYFGNKDGVLVTGMQKIGTVYYCFDKETCRMYTGWQKIDNCWFFFDNNGHRLTGFQKLGTKTYYFDPATGIMLTGWRMLNDHWYFFNDSGHMLKGFQKLGTKTYYFDPESGIMKTGWKELDDIWYFFNESGHMLIGMNRVGTKYYYFDPSGKMQIGFVKLSDGTYYFNEKGQRVSGVQEIKDKKYYFYSSGIMAVNTWIQIDGKYYRIGADGVIQGY